MKNTGSEIKSEFDLKKKKKSLSVCKLRWWYGTVRK